MHTNQKTDLPESATVRRILVGLSSDSPALYVEGRPLHPEEIANPAGGLPAIVMQAGVFRTILLCAPGSATPPPEMAWTLTSDPQALLGVRADLTRPPSDLDWLLLAGTLRQLSVRGADLAALVRQGGIDPVEFSGVACIRRLKGAACLTEGLAPGRESAMPAPNRSAPIRPAHAQMGGHAPAPQHTPHSAPPISEAQEE